ncbi:hypothetical protein [Amycolatopsis aidingensis]|uniref:hypothetical protein n=1 Tax=Amycolatopsis aidingensis TaxID=2842453 RepID=UPI001C0E6A6E|nr:hypothetical protein [Amycolatopsis aidingensis]
MTASTLEQQRAGEAEGGSGGGQRSRPGRWRPRLLALFSVLVGTAAIGWHATVYGYWIVDDAGITFAYARSVAEGLGPVVQPGADPVEGFSNPTWMLLLALGRLLGLFDSGTLFGIPDYVLFPKGLALLCCAGILTLCYRAAARVTSRPWLATGVIGLVLAAIPSFVIWCFSGLANSLFALAITAQAVLLFRAVLDGRLLSSRVALLAGGLAAFAALTRPEGLIYAGSYPLVALALLRRPALGRSIRHAALSVAAFAVPVGGYFCWRYLEFGRLVSNPSVAKKQGLPGLDDLTRPGELVDYAGALAVLLLAVLLGVVLARRAWWRPGLVALLVPLSLALLAFAVLRDDWMAQHRFATPVWALGALAGTLTAVEALRQLGRRARAVGAVGLVAVLAPSAVSFEAAAEEFRTTPNISMCFVADRMGRGFNAYADMLGLEQGSLLLPDLGGSALTSRLRLHDMAGLVSARFADYIAADDKQGQRDYVFEEIKPTFIHSHAPWSELNGIPSDPRLARDYYEIYRYDYAEDRPPNGDWVRKEVVPDQATLAELRAYAGTAMAEIDQKAGGREWPRRKCGATLERGQTATGLT